MAEFITRRICGATYVLIVSSILLTTGCGDKNDQEAKARIAIEESVHAASNGALSITNFEKTDGFIQAVGGNEMYVLEWNAALLVSKDTLIQNRLEKGTLLEQIGNVTEVFHQRLRAAESFDVGN